VSWLHVITWKARWRMQNICYRLLGLDPFTSLEEVC